MNAEVCRVTLTIGSRVYYCQNDMMPHSGGHLFAIQNDDVAKLAALQERVKRLEEAGAFHPRAAKLMQKRKNFVVVAEDEPYFDVVYTAIRAHEKEIGRWTEEDERLWREALRRAAALEQK